MGANVEDEIIEFAQLTIDLMKKKLLTAMSKRGSRYGAISSAQISRNLLQSITMDVRGSGIRTIVDIKMPYYAEYISKGVKGASMVKEGAENSPYSFSDRMPPPKVFSGPNGWISRKGFDLRKDIDKKDKTKGEISNLVIKKNKQLAFLIAKSIKKKGIPGYHFFEFALEKEHIELLREKLKQTMKEIINIEIKKYDNISKK